jgi:hypothetical protein
LPAASVFPKISVTLVLAPSKGQLTAAGQSGILTQAPSAKVAFLRSLLIGFRRTTVSTAKLYCFHDPAKKKYINRGENKTIS